MADPFNGVRAYVRDVKPSLDALDALNGRVDAATLAAMRAAQTAAKARIRSGMRGRPRWDHRGAIGRGGSVPAVSLNLSPHHVTKGGGPGKLSGFLSKSVGGVRRPKRTGSAQYSGGVGVGGPRSVTNLYRKEVEQRAPYMAPGVKKSEPAMAKAWQRAWGKATDI